MIKIGESLKQYWSNQNIKLQNGASELEIRAFEEEHNIVLPADLKDYFLTVNGFADSDVDEDVISFLPLSEGFPAAKMWNFQFPGADSYFVFADYSYYCHSYVIRLANDSSLKTPVFIAYDSVPVQITESFTEFAKAYLANDYSVTFPQ